MIYVYNQNIGLVSCETRQEAIGYMNNKTKQDSLLTVQPRTQYKTKYNQTPYVQYSHSYEALVLYITKRCNDEYPDWTNYTCIAQVFTLTLLKYYNLYKKPYTKEKPIKAGKIKQYGGQIGFVHFKEYFDSCYPVLKSRQYKYGNEKKTATVFWTEIPLTEIEKLVDDKDIIRIMEYCVKKGQYAPSIKQEIRKVYEKTDARWKLRG